MHKHTYQKCLSFFYSKSRALNASTRIAFTLVFSLTFLTYISGRAAFVDRTAELGLNIKGGSACWVDIDADGWVDLCAGGTVWRNNNGTSFTKIKSGVGSVVAADFNNDGFTDLFSYSSKRVYRNIEGKDFKRMDIPDIPDFSSCGACWGDFNGDGFVDIYIGGYENWEKGITFPDLLLLNEQGKGFKIAWRDKRYRARGITACDLDRDGDLDVYISNYRLQPNVLWQNDGAATFIDVAELQGAQATSQGFNGGHSIGAVWGDFDNDGWMDIFAGNFAHRDGRGNQPQSRFLRNLRAIKKAAFKDKETCGVFYQESYASPAAADFDNDGDLDLFFTTVYDVASFGKKNFAVLYSNEGDFKFTDSTIAENLSGISKTYQAAWADFDNDGDLDLVSGGRLYQNNCSGNHWLKVRLVGDGKRVNSSAIGSQVRLVLGDKILTRQVEAGTGQGNQNELCLHFGLGTYSKPVRLQILWPDGRRQRMRGVHVDQTVTVK